MGCATVEKSTSETGLASRLLVKLGVWKVSSMRFWRTCFFFFFFFFFENVLRVFIEPGLRLYFLRRRLQAHRHCCLTGIFFVKWNMRDDLYLTLSVFCGDQQLSTIE